MADVITLINYLGETFDIQIRDKGEEVMADNTVKTINDKVKMDLIVSIRVASMHIYNRADKYVDELTDPENTFISIEFDANGIPSVSVNKSEHVVTPEHVENSLDIKQMWREENADN